MRTKAIDGGSERRRRVRLSDAAPFGRFAMRDCRFAMSFLFPMSFPAWSDPGSLTIGLVSDQCSVLESTGKPSTGGIALWHMHR